MNKDSILSEQLAIESDCPKIIPKMNNKRTEIGIDFLFVDFNSQALGLDFTSSKASW